jgi:hypothetical protein
MWIVEVLDNKQMYFSIIAMDGQKAFNWPDN